MDGSQLKGSMLRMIHGGAVIEAAIFHGGRRKSSDNEASMELPIQFSSCSTVCSASFNCSNKIWDKETCLKTRSDSRETII